MSQLLPFLLIAAALLVVLLLWALRAGPAGTSPQQLNELRNALNVLHLAVPPGLASRIFAHHDWTFIVTDTPKEVQELFLNERKRLAFLWLGAIKGKVREVMALYRKTVRGQASLQPMVEARLAVQYGFFLLVCELLRLLVWLRGPYQVRRLVSYTEELGEQLSVLSIQLVLDPDRISASGPSLRE